MRMYTRLEHGHLPVEILESGYRVTWTDGTQVVYPNARRLLLALYKGRNSGMSFARYFKLGKYNPREGHPTLDLEALRRIRREPRGVDLARYGEDVAKLLYTTCGQAISLYGYDFQEVLQEVYKGILIRNRGRGAWDPAKSAFGYYITMVCRCVFANFHKRESRRRARERNGGWVCQEGAWEQVDVGELASVEPREVLDTVLSEVGECVEDLAEYIADREDAYRQDASFYQDAQLAREVLPLVYAGGRRGEIAEELGVPAPAVGRALAYLRRAAQDWRCERVLH